MTEWRIKEISDMTNTSIRMLRHYDKIGLLKPSYRSSNGYRCYTEKDLAMLQQIIALKYFGFNLNTIKTILQKHQNIYAHLQAQQQVLKEQSMNIEQVNRVLGDILKRLSPSETPDWNDLITLISRYRMTENLREKLKKSWVGTRLSEAQFEQYLSIYEKFPKEFAARDKIIEQINNKELGDPSGPDGERVVSFMYDLGRITKELAAEMANYGSHLLEDIKSGKLTALEVTPEGTLWLSRATLSYWLKRWDSLYNAVLENLKSDPKGKIGKQIASDWKKLTDEYFSMGPRSLFMGIMVWQEMARQEYELKEIKTMLKPQDLVKEWNIKLIFNPEAMGWITQALEAYEK